MRFLAAIAILPFVLSIESAESSEIDRDNRQQRASSLRKLTSSANRHPTEIANNIYDSHIVPHAYYVHEHTQGHRQQQEGFECPIQNVYAGNCTLWQHCREMNLSNDMINFTCKGDVSDTWRLRTDYPETCFYSKTGRNTPQLFDEDEYTPGVDVCAATKSVITFSNQMPTVFEKRYVFTREPFKGVFREFYDLERCEEQPGQLIPGMCETCAGAKIDDEECNQCAACTGLEDLGERIIDCSNVSPELVNGCDTANNDLTQRVVAYFARLETTPVGP